MFADYLPLASCDTPATIHIRHAVPDDAAPIARIYVARHGGHDPTEIIRGALQAMVDGEVRKHTWVATMEGEIAAYARCGWLDNEGARNMPAGWYLTGLMVPEENRRRGMGRQLTQWRMAWLAEQGVERVHFFTAAVNRASYDLHVALGFVEVTRDIWHPTVTFTGGGVLMVGETSAGKRRSPEAISMLQGRWPAIYTVNGV